MRYIFFLLILIWNGYATAQLNGKYTFRHIDQSDGLLHTMVKGIGQDSRGFIWILTLNGLQRYDGSKFVNYPEITHNSSFGIVHDSELYMDTVRNAVWVTKGTEMQSLDLTRNVMTTTSLKTVLEEDSKQNVGVYTDHSQDHWLISENGVIHYEKNTDKIIASFFNINPRQHHRNTYVIKDPTSEDLWSPYFGESYIADFETKTILNPFDEAAEKPLWTQHLVQFGNSNRPRFIMQDSYHNIWISTWNHNLIRYNLDDKRARTYSLKEIKKRQKANEGDLTLLIQAIYEDRQKNLWIATDYAGLLLYNREKDDFEFITSEEKISNGLKYNFSIYTIFQDRDDNIWLGTDRGISIFNPYRNYFQTIRHVDDNDASLPKQDVNDVIETSQGEILIATWGGGISVYDRNWNFIRNVELSGPNAYNLVWSFVQNDDGTIWTGAQQGFIHIYDPVKHIFQTIHPEELENSTITTMTKDRLGNILFGLHSGKIAVWSKSDNKFYKYKDTLDPNLFKYAGLMNLYVDKSNRCWVTSEAGLLEFDIQKRVFINFYQPDSTDAVIGINMKGIEAMNDSTLIIGSIYRGLFLFNQNTKKFSRHPSLNALNQTSIYAIKRDSKGNIWFTTNYSLYKMNSGEGQPTIFNLDHSMMNAAFGSSRFYELSDGRWLTTTMAEIICFDPEKIETNPDDHSDVEISRLKVFDHPVYIDSFLSRHKPVVLPFNKNFISIEFSALDFTDLRQTNYFYRLSGVDKNWIHSTTKQFADYTDLNPGDYIFEVKADNGSGSSGIMSLRISILPPWWATTWFRIVCIIALGLLVYVILKNRIKSIQRQSELKNRIAETEFMALRSQMNPHFIFNCINGIDAMIQSNDKYRATMYLNKFAKLIRNVLDSSKENKVPFSKDIETLQLYIDLELFRHKDKFTASIQVDDELMQNDYCVPPLIIQPYVENAILHGLRHRKGLEGKLSITVRKQESHLTYVIEDNGVGRKTMNGELSKNTQGYGMQIGNDRVRLFNDEKFASVIITDLEVDGQSEGTRVQVQLKLQ